MAIMKQFAPVRILARVVETGSFSKAARALSIGQPAVTRNIATLERELGIRLLKRTTRGVSVTDVGTEVYKRCKNIIHELDEMEAMLGEHRSGVEGVLRVVASVSFGHRVISPMVIDFLDANPGVNVHLTCGNPYADLIAEGADVAIRMGNSPDSTFGQRRVGMNPWAMIASPAYLAQHSEPQSVSDLSGRDALIYSSQHNDDVWSFRMPDGEKRRIITRERMRSNNLPAILDAASAGLGIAVVPFYVALPALQRGTVVQILRNVPLHAQDIYAVLPSATLIPPKAKSFLDFISARFRSEWWNEAKVGGDAVRNYKSVSFGPRGAAPMMPSVAVKSSGAG
jgi:DNA-binding transcriptional LysR family regulator